MSLSPVKPVTVKGVKLTYLTTKTDMYKNENCYFKVSKKDIETKFNKLHVEGYKLPWFEGNDGKYLLKAKFKNVKLNDFIKQNIYITNISFKYYKVDDNEGYYISEINI
jgi:hypothetical protein